MFRSDIPEVEKERRSQNKATVTLLKNLKLVFFKSDDPEVDKKRRRLQEARVCFFVRKNPRNIHSTSSRKLHGHP